MLVLSVVISSSFAPTNGRLGASTSMLSTTNECDGLTSDTVVSTTAQDHSVTTNHTVDEAAGGCEDAQAVPKVHHSNKSSGSGHGCMPSGRHPRKNKSAATCTWTVPKCYASYRVLGMPHRYILPVLDIVRDYDMLEYTFFSIIRFCRPSAGTLTAYMTRSAQYFDRSLNGRCRHLTS